MTYEIKVEATMKNRQWAKSPKGRVFHAVRTEHPVAHTPGRIAIRTECSSVIITGEGDIISGFHVYAYNRCATCLKVLNRKKEPTQ